MVFPFELLCRECGTLIISRRTSARARDKELFDSLEADLAVASWLSDNLRVRKLICPNCRRRVQPDPLVRASVIDGDWGQPSKEDDIIVYYV